jgi:Formyl transferase
MLPQLLFYDGLSPVFCIPSNGAGVPQLVPLEVVRAYKRAILNIHPGLLPAFGGKGYYGQRVHRAVIASGARYSGATVHFVDEEYDTGPILAQRVVPVLPNDTPLTLAARVLEQAMPGPWLLVPSPSYHKTAGCTLWGPFPYGQLQLLGSPPHLR